MAGQNGFFTVGKEHHIFGVMIIKVGEEEGARKTTQVGRLRRICFTVGIFEGSRYHERFH